MTERAGRSSPRHWGKLALGLTSGVAALAVAACNTTGTGGAPGTVQSNPGATVQDTALPARPSAPVLEPVPLLFRAEAWALWDGGRTLDGIWVALPDADRSRRVRITNEDNGATVDGALLPSRSDGRGPAMEISAEAARALGIKPGAPAAVVVVALEYALPPGAEPRMATESPPDLAPVLAAEAGPAPDPVEPGTDAALAAGDGEPGAAQAADPAPVAEIAAVPAVPAAHEPGREERQAPAAEAAPEAPAAITAEAEPAPADAAGTVAVTSAPPPPESAPPAQPAAAPPVIAGVAAILRPPAGPADPPAASEAPARPTAPPAASETPARPAAPPAKSETPASPAPPPPAKTAATAAPVSPAKAETPAPAETTAARTEAPPAAEKPAAPEPPAIADGKPYIQAGVFSQSANAERLVRDLAAAGLLAATVPLQMGRAALFRVVIGPFGSIAARNEALQTVRKIGSADAFPVRG